MVCNTNENGELILRVPNGEYTIESFDYENNNYPINRIVNANNDNPVTWVIDLAIPGEWHSQWNCYGWKYSCCQ